MDTFDGSVAFSPAPAGGAVTVTQLNEYIRAQMDADAFLSRVLVKGEISNFTNHYKTGHFYFTIKDEKALIRAVMFRSSASKLAFVPENGMKNFGARPGFGVPAGRAVSTVLRRYAARRCRRTVFCV